MAVCCQQRLQQQQQQQPKRYLSGNMPVDSITILAEICLLMA